MDLSNFIISDQSLILKHIDYLVDNNLISQHGWKASFSKKTDTQCRPLSFPRIKQAKEMFNMGLRFISTFYFQKRYIDKSMPFINPLDPIEWKPIYGVPIGGFGAGSIARGFRGEFCRSSIVPGHYNFDLNPVDLFLVTLRKRGNPVFQQVLSVLKEPPNHAGIGLKTWSWGFPECHGHYIGLYPRAWTIYELPRFNILLICKQVSPVIPHNYKDTCLPSVCFEWTALNFNENDDIECTITMTWRGPRHPIRQPSKHEGAAVGHSRKTSEDLDVDSLQSDAYKREANTGVRISSIEIPAKSGKLKGCTLETRIGNDIFCCYGLSARVTDGVKVNRCPGFNIDSNKTSSREPYSDSSSTPIPNGMNQQHRKVKEAPSAKDLWESLLNESQTIDSNNIFVSQSSLPYSRFGAPAPGTNDPSHDRHVPDRLAMAVSVTFVLGCASKRENGKIEPYEKKLEFFLVWHTPRVHFRSAQIAYTRRYVRWFPDLGRTGTKHLLTYTADNWKEWNQKIERWQKPYLEDKGLPDWYKSALFNELYFLTDGGTVWLDPLKPVPLKKTLSTTENPNEKTAEENFLLNSNESKIFSFNLPFLRSNSTKSKYNRNLTSPSTESSYPTSPSSSELNNSFPADSMSAFDKIVLEPLPPDILPFDLVRSNVPEMDLDPGKFTGRHLVSCNQSNDNDSSSADSYEKKIKNATWEHRLELGREMGLFGYIEGHEYRMYNTYDVHHFASWAFVCLWPKLQWVLNYDFADQCLAEDRTAVQYIYKGIKSMRSAFMGVPHDLGDPDDEPWRNSNAYIMYPTDNWKDLPTKLVLNVWRDFKFNNDWLYLIYHLPVCYNLIINAMEKFDVDKDGVIENSGFPDQTFDAWVVSGTSAYTGGLWISCIYAMYDMIKCVLSEKTNVYAVMFSNHSLSPDGKSWNEVLLEFESLSQRANISFDRKLWNGLYYNYQDEENDSSHSIMAAQLCGFWSLVISGAPENSVFPKSKIQSVLKVIKTHNWLGVEGGSYGAINGMLPKIPIKKLAKCSSPSDFASQVDISSVQSEEFWIGINYAVAAIMIMEDMEKDAFDLAGSIFNKIYDSLGMQFQTPEAIMLEGKYRSLGYMRPLAIWSMQLAYEKIHGLKTTCSMSH